MHACELSRHVNTCAAALAACHDDQLRCLQPSQLQNTPHLSLKEHTPIPPPPPTRSLHASTSASAASLTSGSLMSTSWNISNSCVGSITALASLLLSTNASARSNVSCARMLAYRKLLRRGSAAASRSASRLQDNTRGQNAGSARTRARAQRCRVPGCWLAGSC